MIGLKVVLIATVAALGVGFSSGFYVKGRFVKADEREAIEHALEDFGVKAQSTLNALQSDWEAKAAESYNILHQVATQRAEDDANELETLKRMKETQDALRKIADNIALVGNVGVCRLDDEFVRLWNEASQAANAERPATDP